MLLLGEGRKRDKQTNAHRRVGRKRDKQTNAHRWVGQKRDERTNALTNGKLFSKVGYSQSIGN